MTTYTDFLASKAQLAHGCGFEPTWLPEFLFPFQRVLADWAIRQGRGGLFADCGMGKSPLELVWADNVFTHTGKPVLLVTPLAVGFQMKAEAEKFGVDAAISRDGKVAAPVTITNYERLEKFNPDDYGGVVCDESSAIKAFDGVRRAIVTEFLRRMPYRLLGTATAAPNDYVELGTSSEALGQLGHIDMLNRFFINAQRTSDTRAGGRFGAKNKEGWRFKGHGQEAFWRWVASWARAIRKPSDYGFDDDGFILPPLEYRTHMVEARTPRPDTLFDVAASGLAEEREVLRRTIHERCEAAAAAVAGHDVSISWCHLNAEGDLLERLIPNSLQVSGSDPNEMKEAAAEWFIGARCICRDPLFRSKLAAWHKGPRGTGRNITKSTVSNGLQSLSNISSEIARLDAPTTASGLSVIVNTSESTSARGRPNETLADESSTQQTPLSGHVPSWTPRRGGTPIPTRTSPSSSENTGSRLINTGNFSPANQVDARSADAPTLMTEEATDPTSITVTTPAGSGGSSALLAILASESSKITPSSSNGQPCICGHASGVRRLVTKPVMFGLGLNFQHCAHMTYFPSHSYEQMYQSVRRSWRFGQKHPVTVDVIITDGGAGILANLQRKAAQADSMFESLVAHMNNAVRVQRGNTFDNAMEVPQWLR